MFSLVQFQMRWDNIALEILIALAWFFALIVYASSTKLRRDKINVNRIKGRFGLLRRGFYRMAGDLSRPGGHAFLAEFG